MKQVKSLVYIRQVRATSRKERKSCVKWKYQDCLFGRLFPRRISQVALAVGVPWKSAATVSYLINIEEGLHSFEIVIVDCSEKSKHSAKWKWHRIIHGISPIEWELEIVD
jgi:hypothetical protein